LARAPSGRVSLLVGLGNPGPRYAGNRHNVGFMALDAIAELHRFPPWRTRFQGHVSDGPLGAGRSILLKPMTFMNESGRAVGEAMRWLKLTAGDVVVMYDEIDLAPGKLRVKTGGGAAGHNGIRSLMAHIGPEFRRVRIGVGHPGQRDAVQRHVLSDFAKADRQWLGPLLVAIADNADRLADGDDPGFMNKVSLALDPDKKKTSAPQRGAETKS
jgi:peptidyl-tRNA hydrolase, PTH1 family